uniref:DUF4283 domain-containing protein n=1 Tax=Tanacetum cinerariifolium TaxID=118510 RepID=A0A699GKU7_TANCI|nr:hypothetical protein [Tanacetum cinerariifolium]
MKPGNLAAKKELSQLHQAQNALGSTSSLFDTHDYSKDLDLVDKVAKILKVKLLFAAKDYAGAISEARFILKEDEDNLDALLLHGRRRNENKGKLRVAVEDYKAALALDPNHVAHNLNNLISHMLALFCSHMDSDVEARMIKGILEGGGNIRVRVILEGITSIFACKSVEEDVPIVKLQSWNLQPLSFANVVEDLDFVLPVAAIHVVQKIFANSLVGYFVGKSVAFPLVKNYVTNICAKFGFQKIMRDDDGLFYFNFDPVTRLEQVLEQGLWLIRNVPIILNKWMPNLSLSKDEVMKIQVWVKMHKVLVVAYSEDGLSLIATQIGKPIMLDAFTSFMCVDSWGRIGFARALIKVITEKDLKQEVTMAIPVVEGEQCPTRVQEPVRQTMDVQEDGFTIVKNRKNKGKKQPDDEPINIMKLKNHFDSLRDQEDVLRKPAVGESSGGNMNKSMGQALPLMMFIMFSIAAWNIKRLNRALKQSKVSRSSKWTSNASLCSKGFIEILMSRGHNMFKVVSKLKLLKKPLRKLLLEHGNLHDHVNKLRLELDEVQKALDLNPSNSILHEEEGVYIQAYNGAKKRWNIVGQDVCNPVRDFFSNGLLLKEINHTFLALIPKGIKEVVSKNQFVFVSGRRISDNILIMQERMHNYHRNRGPPRCAFKVDIQKAYDTVDCLNGNIHRFFKGKRGLRQDDLFFARGDVESARVIMDSLEEFKKTSGELPVKYLGDPLISLRLLNKDCKVLVEKAKNKIDD